MIHYYAQETLKIFSSSKKLELYFTSLKLF